MIARLCLWILVSVGETFGRMLRPSRQLFVTYSHGLYGTRHWSHFQAYSAAPGWFFIEMGSWTVEALWRTRWEVSRLKLGA